MRRVWLALAGFISRYHFLIIAVALAATVALAFGLPRIRFKTGQDAFLASRGVELPPQEGGVQRENPPLPGVTGGVPLNLIDFPRAGGWEE